MALVKTSLITGPSGEPWELADIKRHLRIEIGETEENELLNVLGKAARRRVETITNRKLINQTWKAYYDSWSTGDDIVLPYTPLSTGTAPVVTYVDSTGNSNTFSSTGWRSDSVTEPPRVVLTYSQDWPTATLDNMNPINVQFVCGYGTRSSDVPEDIRVAMNLLVANLYEFRESMVLGRIVTKVPDSVNALLAPHRVWT